MLHPILASAAEGHLPEWRRVSPKRREHIERVRELMANWARELGESVAEVDRWRAGGMLHDVLRDAEPSELDGRIPAEFSDLPVKMLHGPVAAERLRDEGVEDEGFLRAVAFHTIGHPGFDRMGRFLYAADFLEPGRKQDPKWRGRLRSRMVQEPDSVLREVARARLRALIDNDRPLRPETRDFWNALVGEPNG